LVLQQSRGVSILAMIVMMAWLAVLVPLLLRERGDLTTWILIGILLPGPIIMIAYQTYVLIRPARLRADELGIECDRGWRRDYWPWSAIFDVITVSGRWGRRTILRFVDRADVELAGWSLAPEDLTSELRARKRAWCPLSF
jgi:hypothetical protein